MGQFRVQLSTTSEPLRDSQADALVEAIYSERQRRSREYEEYVKNMGITDRNIVSPQDRQRWLDLEKEANQRIHDTMAGALSSAQLSSLDEILATRLVPIEAELRLQLEGKLAKQHREGKPQVSSSAVIGSRGLAIASIYLWRELDLERGRNAELRARLESSAPNPASVRALKATCRSPRQHRRRPHPLLPHPPLAQRLRKKSLAARRTGTLTSASSCAIRSIGKRAANRSASRTRRGARTSFACWVSRRRRRMRPSTSCSTRTRS